MAVAAPQPRPARRAAAEPARATTRSRPRHTGTRRSARPRLGRGVVWILAIAGLLAGIVALQVTVLQLRMERGRLQSEIVEIEAQNAKLESEISSAASVARIEGAARGPLGLVPPSKTTYLELPGR
jgi:cell division protein FtsL